MTEFTTEQIHSMCRYLKEQCHDCPRRVDTSFGPGVHGCYAIAEETLAQAQAILAPLADPEDYSGETPEQTRFRKYYESLKVGRSFARTKDGSHVDPFVRDLWEGWQRMLATERTGAPPGPSHPPCDCQTPQPTQWEPLLCERCYGRLSPSLTRGPVGDAAAKARISDSTGEHP